MPINEATLAPAVFWALLIGSAVLSGIGDIFVFQWARETGWWRLAIGIGIWAISLVLMGLIFRNGSARFSVIIVLLLVIHVMLDMAWDMAVLGTRFNKTEWAGFGLAIVAVVLLQFGRGQSDDVAPGMSEVSEPQLTDN